MTAPTEADVAAPATPQPIRRHKTIEESLPVARSVWREHIANMDQSQNMAGEWLWPPAATAPMSMAAPMEFDAAPPATSDGPPVPDDDGEESDGPNSTANEWEMVCRMDCKLCFEVLRAGYNFHFPDMPDAATLLPFRIVRFVEFVVADGGKHFIHNLGLNMCNHS